MEEGQAAIEVLRQEKEVKDEALKVVENQMEVARVIQQVRTNLSGDASLKGYLPTRSSTKDAILTRPFSATFFPFLRTPSKWTRGIWS